MQDLIAVDSRKINVRIALAAAMIVALACGAVMVKWQLANMLATLTRTNDPNAGQVARIASDWGPADPAASWLLASTENDIALFERTVRLAPYDYRWRAELGRAFEQDEQPARSEAEFKRAVELAPSYAFPRWRLANFYLRQDRVDEALAELRKAAENNQTYREQAFSLVWDLFDKDPAIVESLAGDHGESRARLAYFFASRGRAADALRVWNTLSEADRNANPQLVKGMAMGLYLQRHFPESLQFAKEAGLDPDAEPEAVTNPSFEKGLADWEESRFGWKIARNDPKFDVAVDQKVKLDGNRSLRVTFRNFVKPELYNIYQTVAVSPSTRYRLRFSVRTENLKSAGTPLLEIVNANNDMLITRSQPYGTGSNDWQEFTLEFNTPDNCSGINIRTARAYCGEGCPIVGIFWYDNFEMRRM